MGLGTGRPKSEESLWSCSYDSRPQLPLVEALICSLGGRVLAVQGGRWSPSWDVLNSLRPGLSAEVPNAVFP